MVRIPLPFTDAYFLLSPQWDNLSRPMQVLALLLLCTVPAALVLWLYRYELRLIHRRTAALLLLLRLIALALLVLLVGFQPIYARSHVEELPGRVLVAVDRSGSMDIADPQRPAAEKLRLALALKLADDICPEEQLRDWAQQCEEGGAVTRWVSDGEYPNDAAKRRQLEAERRAKYEQVCRRADALTRSEAARRVLADDGARLLATVSARHKVEVIGFSQEAWEVKPDAIGELFAPPQEAEKRTAGAAATDLRLALVRALERSGPEQGKVLGVVLLSDGQHNWGESPVKKAVEMGEHKLPLFPVALGTRTAPPDVALVSVKAPPAVFKDVDTQIEARVKVSGIREKKQLLVQLQRPGQDALEETVAHDGTDRYHTVRFQVRLDKPGTQALTVTAKPIDGETRSDNNSRTAVINVADDKAKVLLVDGEARWEYHYLANALFRDRTMQPQGVVFQQPRLGAVPEDELKQTGHPWLTLPAEPDALAAYDCIILGDVLPSQLPPAERVRLEKYVADRGGTLVIVAGKRAMPLAFSNEESDPLARLLPIEQPRVIKPTQGFSLTLTYDGKSTPFLQLEAEPDKNVQRWSELPRHYWGVVGRAKPGATVLAYVVGPDATAGKKPALEQEREQALIVRHNYGFGRVLYVGLDSTWRWRYKVGDTYHHKFWGQAIRWAAADKPLVTGNAFVRFGTREAVHRQGQEIELVVRLSEEAGSLPADAVAGARVQRLKDDGGEEAVALVPLNRREAQPRVLEGKLRDLPAGRYAVELAIPDLGDKLHGPDGPLRATFTVTAPDGGEMVELAANWPLLEELAARSGGRAFTADNVSGLLDALTKRAVRHEERVENRLYQWWVVLVVALGLLTLEWVGRKLAGLP